MSDLKLLEAVKNGEFAEVERLIKAGANVNYRDEQGWNALNFAAGQGNLPLVKLLVESGADVFSIGRDHRTPYDIALAAGRVSAVKYLREVESRHPRENASRPERKYCKAYHLGDLRKYPQWHEDRIDRSGGEAGNNGNNSGHSDDPLPDDKIVFVHQDLTVTESMWHNENIIFDQVDFAWKEFCANTLKFEVPDDLDLIVINEPQP
jgi:ankyrin repeat protein